MANIGSISSGTMKENDLIVRFIEALEPLDKERAMLLESRVKETLFEQWVEGENPDLSDVLESLMEELDGHALPYFYFGAHAGDGADFGWWLNDDALEDEFGAFADDEHLKVSDLEEVPASFAGEVLVVSDHGNATLYAATTESNTKSPRFKEIWSLVMIA